MKNDDVIELAAAVALLAAVVGAIFVFHPGLSVDPVAFNAGVVIVLAASVVATAAFVASNKKVDDEP